jgi:Glycosyl transferase family 11
MMIITQLLGGLGNQMFQYAIGRRLAYEHGHALKVDTSVLEDHSPGRHHVNRTYDLDIFTLTVERATRVERKRFNPQGLSIFEKSLFRVKRVLVGDGVYHEKSFEYDEQLATCPSPPQYLKGLWQSYKYVAPVRELLLGDFQHKSALSASVQRLAGLIQQPNSVCLNVRRTDYISIPSTASIMGFVGIEYYKKAVERLCNELNQPPRFFVFSDDLDWCRSSLRWLPSRPIFVSHRLAGPKFSDYLQLMRLANHFIIPNSTFAWWAAWLSERGPKFVVAPRRWFNDECIDSSQLCPPEWIRL